MAKKLSAKMLGMSERRKFSEEPWHQYYQHELKAKYSPVVQILASKLQEGTKKRNPVVTHRFVWWDIENHSIVVSEAARIMAKSSSDNLGATVEEITAGVLLHDITKPQEIIFDDLKDNTAAQRVMIQNLVTEGHARQEDLDVFDSNPNQGLSIFEAAIHEKEGKSLLREHRKTLTQFGNPRKILALSDSSGIPVIYLPKNDKGHHLHSLAQRIIFIADQLVQGTTIVNLKTRHQKARKRYNPQEIDALYEYAYRCADEITKNIGLSSHEELPSFVQAQISTSHTS